MENIPQICQANFKSTHGFNSRNYLLNSKVERHMKMNTTSKTNYVQNKLDLAIGVDVILILLKVCLHLFQNLMKW